MTDNGQQDLARRIARAVSEQLGFAIQVKTGRGRIVLSGTADSASARAAAEQTVADLAPGMRIDNGIQVARAAAAPGESAYADHDRRGDTRPPRGMQSLEADEPSDLDPGFTDQPLETNAINPADDDVPDLDPSAEPDPTYFPPTDPVLGQNDGGSPEVVGGFDATSMSSDEVERPTTGGPGDEAIADAIRRELREDALTTDLGVAVEVEMGVARLRGAVPSAQDADSAEAVAGRVPGVREVVDEMGIAPQP